MPSCPAAVQLPAKPAGIPGRPSPSFGLQAEAAKQDLERLLSNSRFEEIQRIQKAAAEEVAAAQKQLQEVGDEARTRAAAEIDVMRVQTAATVQEARWGRVINA